MTFDSDLHSHDQFLGGRLMVAQPKTGYRAGVDPVLLAASVPAVRGESVLELGCGVGVASLCLAARVPGLAITGVEIQPDAAILAAQNAQHNGCKLTVITADIASPPAALRGENFDFVIANPPYFDRAQSSPAPHQARERALGEQTPLKIWVKLAAKRLRPKGYAHFIFRSERLQDFMAVLPDDLGSLQVVPIAPRKGRESGLMLLRARKAGRANFRLMAPLILHEGDRHRHDGDTYTALVSSVLRNGADLVSIWE